MSDKDGGKVPSEKEISDSNVRKNEIQDNEEYWRSLPSTSRGTGRVLRNTTLNQTESHDDSTEHQVNNNNKDREKIIFTVSANEKDASSRDEGRYYENKYSKRNSRNKLFIDNSDAETTEQLNRPKTSRQSDAVVKKPVLLSNKTMMESLEEASQVLKPYTQLNKVSEPFDEDQRLEEIITTRPSKRFEPIMVSSEFDRGRRTDTDTSFKGSNRRKNVFFGRRSTAVSSFTKAITGQRKKIDKLSERRRNRHIKLKRVSDASDADMYFGLGSKVTYNDTSGRRFILIICIVLWTAYLTTFLTYFWYIRHDYILRTKNTSESSLEVFRFRNR